MSRIGKQPVKVPAGVTAEIQGRTVAIKGPKGHLSLDVHPAITAVHDAANGRIVLTRADDQRFSRAIHGTMRALVNNMVRGVSEGYSKTLEVIGVGYQARLQGRELTLVVGFAHPVVMTPPEQVTVTVPNPTQIIITGPDRQAVGEFAAEVRAVRPPEPYKGKGIKYREEVIRRKAGKAFVTTE